MSLFLLKGGMHRITKHRSGIKLVPATRGVEEPFAYSFALPDLGLFLPRGHKGVLRLVPYESVPLKPQKESLGSFSRELPLSF